MIFSFHFEFDGQLLRTIKFLRDRAMFGLWSSLWTEASSTGREYLQQLVTWLTFCKHENSLFLENFC